MATAIKTKPPLTAALKLSAEDRECLMEFNLQRDILKMRAEAVARRTQNGLVVHGPPGIGKSKTVRDKLDSLPGRYRWQKGWCTARGLFDLLDANPTSVIVLDDLGSMMNDRATIQILLAALDGTIGEPRQISWTKFGSDPAGDVVHFSGGVVAISNNTLPDTVLCEALRNRVPCLEFNPSRAERRAVLRSYANEGYRCGSGSMEPAECREVVEYVLEQLAALQQDAGVDHQLDFRKVIRAYSDYLTCKGQRGIQWRQAVLHDLRSSPTFKAKDTSTKRGRLELEKIAFLKAKAENDRLPKGEQLSITALGKLLGISRGKAYGFLSGK